MITVSVQTDIESAMRELNLLPQEANRAAYRAMNKIADEIRDTSAKSIAEETGLTIAKVRQRMYVDGASSNKLIASVHALPSAKNVGYYPGAYPVPVKGKGVNLKAWRTRSLYDKAFVMGKQGKVSGITRKVWKRTGPGKGQISDQVWGPSIRKSFERPFLRARQMAILNTRWPYWFEHYLRGEIGKLQGFESLAGVKNVLPSIVGPTLTDE